MTPQEQFIEYQMRSKKDATLESYKDIKILTFITNIRGEEKPALMIFIGKRKNPECNYYYQTDESRMTTIERYKQAADSRQEYKEKRKAERKAFRPDFEIGTIFCASWGYEQTNLNFYQVIGKKGKCTAILREIAQQSVEGSTYSHGMADERIPIKDSFISDKIIEKRVGQGNLINFESYKSASKWNGKPKYCSWYY